MRERDLPDHAVIIASMGRPQVLAETLASLFVQTAHPGLVILSVTSENDLPDALDATRVKIVTGGKGLPVQRNAGIDHLADGIEYVSFLDDDVELDPAYLETVHTFLSRNAQHVLVDGFVVIDDDVSRVSAKAALSEPWARTGRIADSANAYGCNMTARRTIVDKVRFDERLRLHAWLEDADFSRRCLEHGLCAQVMDARLVHLRAPAARISGRRHGFAQITNSYYLRSKGQMSLAGLLLDHWAPALCSNAWGAFFGNDGKIDRRGRLIGNLIAIRRIFSFGCNPEYVELIHDGTASPPVARHSADKGTSGDSVSSSSPGPK